MIIKSAPRELHITKRDGLFDKLDKTSSSAPALKITTIKEEILPNLPEEFIEKPKEPVKQEPAKEKEEFREITVIKTPVRAPLKQGAPVVKIFVQPAPAAPAKQIKAPLYAPLLKLVKIPAPVKSAEKAAEPAAPGEEMTVSIATPAGKAPAKPAQGKAPQQPAPAKQLVPTMEKLLPFLADPSVNAINCPGPGRNLILTRAGVLQQIQFTLTKDEIRIFLEDISAKTRIPLLPGLFKVIYQNMLITAVVSEYLDTKFIIEKRTFAPAPVAQNQPPKPIIVQFR